MPRQMTVKKSPHVSTKSAFVRKRNAAVRKSFEHHLSVVRKQSCECAIRMMDELAASDSLTDDVIHRAICADTIGAENVEEYLGKDNWVYMFNDLFDYQFTVCDWTDFFELDYTKSKRLLRQHAIGYVEGLAIWWNAVREVTEDDEPKPTRKAKCQPAAA